jgi:hypothetical protein
MIRAPAPLPPEALVGPDVVACDWVVAVGAQVGVPLADETVDALLDAFPPPPADEADGAAGAFVSMPPTVTTAEPLGVRLNGANALSLAAVALRDGLAAAARLRIA